MTTNKGSKQVKLKGKDSFSVGFTTGRLMLADEKGLAVGSVESGILGGMFMDPLKLAEACWVLFSDRLNKAGVDTKEEFYDLLDAEANRDLDNAMKNSVRDFFTWGDDYVSEIEAVLSQMRDSIRQAREQQEAQVAQPETKTSSGQPSGSAQESAD